ncbi:alpha/beta hydrolase family protein [Phaeobacter piscinae]|uniref:alpha/beta hydrolase family protein n=1 Tax=Phaeobacter piscinae TaxID=1580596 RepID=UPI00059033E9|nr:dienelactone hydrolase-related enzyme [Phaeobacter piscinae]UTS82752.1 hypothetical protein OL67_003862 [Phaeobacter piscinae]
MYHSWLDRWDERRAQRGEEEKKVTKFSLGAGLGFPDATAASIEEFCALADQAVADPTFYEERDIDQGFVREGDWLKFPSSISSEIEENNTVWAKVSEGGSLNQALVVFHHWNASSRQSQIASFFSRRGVTVVEMALPYHFERSRPGSSHADYMLSSNLGRTVGAMRQAVCDGRKLIRWLKAEGYSEIAVLGMSLGSWVAGLVAAHDTTVSKASLFLTAGSMADMVWTGRATQAIRQSLEGKVGLPDLRRAWGTINQENYARQLVRPDLDLQLILAKRDRVVLPQISHSFVQRLKEVGGSPDVLELNCGHYSLALPPHILFAGLRLKKLLGRGR